MEDLWRLATPLATNKIPTDGLFSYNGFVGRVDSWRVNWYWAKTLESRAAWQNFVPQEANIIKRKPLARMEAEGTLYWPFSQDGYYTCKLGYWFLKSDSELRTHEPEQNHDKELWKGIWSLHVPDKVKNFLCRACRNSMPTNANLVRRTVINDPVCDRCRSALEDQIQALWSCPQLNEVWSDALLWGLRASSQFGTFKELVTMIFQK